MQTWFGAEMSTEELQEYIGMVNDRESITIGRCPICSELFENCTTALYQQHLKNHLG